MDITNEKIAIDFLLFSYFGFDSADGKEIMKSKSTHRAYLDLARTVKYRYSASELDEMKDKKKAQGFKDKKDAQVDSICKEVFARLSDDIQNFDSWHSDVCDKICKMMTESGLLKKGFTFTYGQAQKWLNMTLKYLWLLDLLPDKIKEGSLHVPIDGYILEKLKKLGIDKITGSGETYKYNNKEWSKIGKEDYQSLQAAIRNSKETPIRWEGKAWIEIAKDRQIRKNPIKDKENQ